MATITTIQSTDKITDSRAVINTNFSNLNTDKIEADSTDTLTNKTIDANSNTISNISNAELDTTAGALGGAWQSWTPTWTTSVYTATFGNAVLDCKYIQIGKTIIARFNITFGSTTDFGTSTNWRFSLPVEANFAKDTVIGQLRGTGGGNSYYFAEIETSTTFQLAWMDGTSPVPTPTGTDYNQPGTWVSGNQILGTLTYEAA